MDRFKRKKNDSKLETASLYLGLMGQFLCGVRPRPCGRRSLAGGIAIGFLFLRWQELKVGRDENGGSRKLRRTPEGLRLSVRRETGLEASFHP